MNAIAAALSPMTPPQAAPQNARGDEARGDEFARRLDQACESEPPEPPEASEGPQRPAAKAHSARDTTAPRKAEASTAKQVRPEDRIAADAAAESEAEATGPAEGPHDEAAAPDIAALLPGWSPPAIVVASAGASAAAAGASTVGTDGTGASQGATATLATGGITPAPSALRDDIVTRAAKSPAAQPVRGAATGSDNTPSTTAPSSAQLQAAASEHKDAPPGSSAAAAPAPATTAFAAPSTTPATAAKAAEAELPTATVQAAIDTPTFAPSLATQVRWWAHDGVQQAQLLLNPAEMGPVTVKIVLDGREARIDFSADQAATRGAIEAALPVLAAALDDSGLKLTGGGVHDGSAQRQPAWNAHSVTHRTAAGAATRDDGRPDNAAAIHVGPGRGIVDLVA